MGLNNLGKAISTAFAMKSNGRKSWPYEVDLPEFYLPVQQGLQHFKRHRNSKRLHFEQRNPKTKERSYCGVHIPTGAPPKPNNQTEWNEETGNSRRKKVSEQKKFRNPTSAEWWYNKRPDVFLKRRGVSTKTSGRFKKTSGGCPQNALLTPSKPNFRRKTFVRLNICRTFTFRILHYLK